MSTISISRSDADAVIEHARKGAPDEVCGLVGVRDGRICRLTPARNASPTPRNRFEIDSRDLVQVIRDERDGLDVGFYHSHPASRAYPSATDIHFAALWPGALQLMVSLRNDRGGKGVPELHAYRINGDRVEELRLIIE
ncbi:MAG: M67 family peptidase [Chloroflexi bacterium]|nr:MAG: M67 family peptidase [Chloroflexota bacterium]